MNSPEAKPAPRVALVSGHWGQNIGNAFFNIGGKWILEQIFGAESVDFIQDQSGYRTFHDQSKGNSPNDVEYLKYLDIDYIVLQGPLLTAEFAFLWRPTLTELARRGTKVILLGSAFFKFRDAEFAAVKSFLAEFPPALISTRDARSFEVLKSWDLRTPLYSGIDSAFFAPKVYTPFKYIGQPYYAFNFDRYPEPTIAIGRNRSTSSHQIEVQGESWALHTPDLVSKLAHRSKVQAYFGHMLDRRKLPSQISGRMIVRPEHRVNPHLGYKIYQHPNGVASDEPWTYFTVYANADLTLADRVHACAITLAYGKPAMLFTPSPRSALFDRIGCEAIREGPVTLDADYLEDERQREVAWLRSTI